MAMLWKDKKGISPKNWERFQRGWARPAIINTKYKMDNLSLSQMIGNKIMLQDIIRKIPKQINVEDVIQNIGTSNIGGVIENIETAIITAPTDTYITLKDRLLDNKIMVLLSIFMITFAYVFWNWYNDKNILPKSLQQEEKEE